MTNNVERLCGWCGEKFVPRHREYECKFCGGKAEAMARNHPREDPQDESEPKEGVNEQ